MSSIRKIFFVLDLVLQPKPLRSSRLEGEAHSVSSNVSDSSACRSVCIESSVFEADKGASQKISRLSPEVLGNSSLEDAIRCLAAA